jgi:hypothetical protein
MSLLPWLFAPDWAEGIAESLEWLTDILTSPAGVEQCRALRRSPRRSWRAAFILRGEERTRFTLMLARNGGQRWLMPVWPDYQWVYGLTAGQRAIGGSTTGRDFVVGGRVIVMYGQDYELATIAGLTASSVVLAAPLTRSWSAAQFAPVRTVRLADTPAIERVTDDMMTVSATFSSTDDSDWPQVTPAQYYRGYPVMTEQPDASNDITHSYQRLLLTLDNSINTPQITDTARLPFIAQSYNWTLAGANERANWRAWRYLLRGRQGRVWLPTFNQDFTLAADISAGRTLLINSVGFAEYGDVTTPGQRDIQIALADGSLYHARIIAASAATATTEAITLDQTLPSIPATSVARISFLVLSRQDSDVAELTHITDVDGIATSQMVFKGVYE